MKTGLIYGILLFALGTLNCAANDNLPAPDYSQPSAWAAYPGRTSRADEVPAGVPKHAAKSQAPEADVFFVHPTTYLASRTGNAAFDEAGKVGEIIDDAVLPYQASAFNDCCRIFAPHYRQASLGAITGNSPEDYAAAELAYGDVARAFDEFLRVSGDRPFILASHSQGSIHALRLLQEKIAGTRLQKRLVAAYLVGTALPKQIGELGVPVCAGETATGCVLTWNTVRKGHVDRRRKEDAVLWWQGHYESIAGRPLVCVNPLDWREDSGEAATANLGSVYHGGRDAPIPAPVPNVTGAWCEDGLLGVDISLGQRRHFGDILTVFGVYHDFDYGLFYMNIRANAQVRLQSWKSANAGRAAN